MYCLICRAREEKNRRHSSTKVRTSLVAPSIPAACVCILSPLPVAPTTVVAPTPWDSDSDGDCCCGVAAVIDNTVLDGRCCDVVAVVLLSPSGGAVAAGVVNIFCNDRPLLLPPSPVWDANENGDAEDREICRLLLPGEQRLPHRKRVGAGDDDANDDNNYHRSLCA